jgi:hypothetical protein
MKKLWFWLTYPYQWYKERKSRKERIKKLRELDPFIYK